jgi:hypothetical protein
MIGGLRAAEIHATASPCAFSARVYSDDGCRRKQRHALSELHKTGMQATRQLLQA